VGSGVPPVVLGEGQRGKINGHNKAKADSPKRAQSRALITDSTSRIIGAIKSQLSRQNEGLNKAFSSSQEFARSAGKKGGLFDYAPRAQRGLIPGAAVCYFQMRFSALSYCRRVDLECDKHGIGGGSNHCDDNDAQPDA